jgi:hypothetical protein
MYSRIAAIARSVDVPEPSIVPRRNNLLTCLLEINDWRFATRQNRPYPISKLLS